jgi:hypothetical protein
MQNQEQPPLYVHIRQNILDNEIQAAGIRVNQQFVGDAAAAQPQARIKQNEITVGKQAAWAFFNKTKRERRPGQDLPSGAQQVSLFKAANPGCQAANRTVERWYAEWLSKSQEEQDVPPEPAKRGCRGHLTEDEEKILVARLRIYEARCVRLDPRIPCIIGESLLRRERPKDYLATRGTNVHMFTTKWGRDFLKKNDFRRRAATGDRSVPPAEIVAQGNLFYQALKARDKCTSPHLIYNMDELCCFLDESERRWTYINKNSRQVHIKKNRIAFTCSVLTNMAGEALLLQVIFKGSTRNCLPNFDACTEFDAVQKSKLLLQHSGHKNTHYQNNNTFKTWCSHLSQIDKKLRREHNIGDDVESLCFLDHATQHDTDFLQNEFKIPVEKIPRKCTHVFQPADQEIIPELKNKAIDASKTLFKSELTGAGALALEIAKQGADASGLDPEMKAQFERLLLEVGITAGMSRYDVHAKVAKLRKTKMLLAGFCRVSDKVVQKAWFHTGIPQNMGFINPLDRSLPEWVVLERIPEPVFAMHVDIVTFQRQAAIAIQKETNEPAAAAPTPFENFAIEVGEGEEEYDAFDYDDDEVCTKSRLEELQKMVAESVQGIDAFFALLSADPRFKKHLREEKPQKNNKKAKDAAETNDRAEILPKQPGTRGRKKNTSFDNWMKNTEKLKKIEKKWNRQTPTGWAELSVDEVKAKEEDFKKKFPNGVVAVQKKEKKARGGKRDNAGAKNKLQKAATAKNQPKLNFTQTQRQATENSNNNKNDEMMMMMGGGNMMNNNNSKFIDAAPQQAGTRRYEVGQKIVRHQFFNFVSANKERLPIPPNQQDLLDRRSAQLQFFPSKVDVIRNDTYIDENGVKHEVLVVLNSVMDNIVAQTEKDGGQMWFPGGRAYRYNHEDLINRILAKKAISEGMVAIIIKALQPVKSNLFDDEIFDWGGENNNNKNDDDVVSFKRDLQYEEWRREKQTRRRQRQQESEDEEDSDDDDEEDEGDDEEDEGNDDDESDQEDDEEGDFESEDDDDESVDEN